MMRLPGSTCRSPSADEYTMIDPRIEKFLEKLVKENELSTKGVKDLLEEIATKTVRILVPKLIEMNVKSELISDQLAEIFDLVPYPHDKKLSLLGPSAPMPIQPKMLEHGGNDKEGWMFCANGILYLTNPLDVVPVKGKVADLRAKGLKNLGVVSRGQYLTSAGIQSAETEKGRPDTGDSTDKYTRKVDHILSSAVRLNASDIHFEPGTTDVRIRFRIENRMRIIDQMPHDEYLKLANILLSKTTKGKAGTYIEALDDMFVYQVPPARRVKMRVMMIPVVVPERQDTLPCFCLRILGNNIEKMGLRDLGIPDTEKNNQLTQLQLLMERKNGLILVSGPTGSGKTTTLTAILSEMQRMHPDRCRYTVEDPVEMNLAGVNHVQVNEDAGLTFARAIKSFLRGDPDEILVGEVRDGTVGGLATTASITGHLAFSTIHTNSAIQCVARLIDMGCDSYIVSDSMKAATAQRLVRKVCKNCSTDAKWGELTSGRHPMLQDPENALMKFRYHHAPKFYQDLDDYPKDPEARVKIANPAGCPQCGNSGYAKRLLVTELFVVSPAIVDLIARRASSTELKRQAFREGFKEMWQHGATEIFVKKSTTFDEMIQCLGEREPFDVKPAA